ncbi:dihydrolipoyl dehydrogenase family protein [Arthrobacter roseus]|uniref:dihydrolipoyl dehydrogenase family protein n=1 Tax=Arthrobacter roseus TaxID=136274 RepID=UPI0019661D86|nr:NAD(P)/FAD-dependent oxidoreductase [Arthrobacter roseus]MBM7847620.1 dihydrolipoamide dehydrogenase [Arthrobacter roseus]
MTENEATDVIVIGAGAVGENVAGRVVEAGLSATLVESALIGGECSYWACMPSKALLRPGTALKAARSVAGSREAVAGGLDANAVLERRNSFTSNWDDSSQEKWVADAGIQLMRGKARLSAPRTVEVRHDDGGTSTLTARVAVVLATGSTPTQPPIKGLDSVEYWGTREATSAQEVPQSLAVIGGGVAGTELAQAFARLGSQVTMLVRGDLLETYPEPARRLVAKALEQDGVDLLLQTEASGVSATDDGVELTMPDGSTLKVEKLLVSTGRHPALADLGLEELGLDIKNLDPDDTGRVNDWLYAVGDAAGKVLLTHQGKYEARATADAIAGRVNGKVGDSPEPWSTYCATADHHAVPQVVFTDPEIAMVGMTLQQAQDAGLNVSETSLDIAVAGSALFADDYKGWAQMVVDEDRKVLLGMLFAGPGVSELLHSATIAIVGEVPLERLWHAVPAYPTISEVWLRLLEKYGL